MSGEGKKISRKGQITREVFLRTLDELLDEMDFDRISTTDIIERSGLSRATFYKHFRDKYQLANWRYYMLLETAIERGFSSGNDIDESMSEIIRFIDRNRKTLTKLIRYTGQNSFMDYYLNHSIAAAREISEKKGRKLSRRNELLIRYNAVGAAEVYKEWLLNEKDLSAEDVIQIIIGCMSDEVKALYLNN